LKYAQIFIFQLSRTRHFGLRRRQGGSLPAYEGFREIRLLDAFARRHARARARARRALSCCYRVTFYLCFPVRPLAKANQSVSPRRTSRSRVAGIGERSDATINRGVDNLLYPHCCPDKIPLKSAANVTPSFSETTWHSSRRSMKYVVQRVIMFTIHSRKASTTPFVFCPSSSVFITMHHVCLTDLSASSIGPVLLFR